MITFEKGKKYKSNATGRVFTCVFAGARVAVMELNGDQHLAYQGADYLKEYIEPPKPFRIRTVVAQNTVTGGLRVASIMDNYEFHRVDDPTWPTGWGTGNERRVYDEIVKVNR